MDTLVEVHIGTKFKTKDFSMYSITSDATRASLHELQRLISEAKEDKEFIENPLSNPSKRNAILSSCADYIITFAQIMKEIAGEYPKPTVTFVAEDAEDELDSIREKLDKGNTVSGLLSTLIVSALSGDTEHAVKEFTNVYADQIKSACISAYTIAKEIDLEPYILQRISERS